MISLDTVKGLSNELGKIAAIPMKLLANPKFSKYFERVAAGGKGAPRLFKGGPPVNIPGVSPPTKPPSSLKVPAMPRVAKA